MTLNKMGGACETHGAELRTGFGWANLKERDRKEELSLGGG